MLREAAPIITSSLTHIFNDSLEKGEFPDAWKLLSVPNGRAVGC
ncbi:unnamed protein product, partial [Didymodactylos carnosus]